MLLLLILLSVLLVGLVIGVVIRGLLLPREDRRRLDALAAGLVAEQRIDQLTRATFSAMRGTARQGRQP